ncbi:MAG: tripartite tricarboxylate transporter substrate binding protein [Limnohabitans sp.]|nr:tripartite tricarboxylate transporter substrate binding protein [Limnohabitans sp.]
MNMFNDKYAIKSFTLSVVTFCCTFFAFSLSAISQVYPNKPVTLIVGWPPGGGADIVSRIMAEGLSATLNQTVTVKNLSGASGNLGAEATARSAADGYTLLLVGGNHVTNSHLYSKLNFDPTKDFEPVSLLTIAPNLLVVNPNLPVHNLAEFIALVRSKPGQLSYGSAGNGTTGHLAMELLKATAKIDILHVPYKGGGPFVTDLVGGHVMLGFDNILSSGPQINGNRIRAIATSGSQRISLFSELPTVAESGYPGFEVLLWQGLLAPAGTPKDIIARLNIAVHQALIRPETIKRFKELALEGRWSSPEDFRKFLIVENEKWGKLIKSIGVRLD